MHLWPRLKAAELLVNGFLQWPGGRDLGFKDESTPPSKRRKIHQMSDEWLTFESWPSLQFRVPLPRLVGAPWLHFPLPSCCASYGVIFQRPGLPIPKWPVGNMRCCCPAHLQELWAAILSRSPSKTAVGAARHFVLKSESWPLCSQALYWKGPQNLFSLQGGGEEKSLCVNSAWLLTEATDQTIFWSRGSLASLTWESCNDETRGLGRPMSGSMFISNGERPWGSIHHVMRSFLAKKRLVRKPGNDHIAWGLEPSKQALWVSRDVMLVSQICGSKLQWGFSQGDGLWLPSSWLGLQIGHIWHCWKQHRGDIVPHEAMRLGLEDLGQGYQINQVQPTSPGFFL